MRGGSPCPSGLLLEGPAVPGLPRLGGAEGDGPAAVLPRDAVHGGLQAFPALLVPGGGKEVRPFIGRRRQVGSRDGEGPDGGGGFLSSGKRSSSTEA